MLSVPVDLTLMLRWMNNTACAAVLLLVLVVEWLRFLLPARSSLSIAIWRDERAVAKRFSAALFLMLYSAVCHPALPTATSGRVQGGDRERFACVVSHCLGAANNY